MAQGRRGGCGGVRAKARLRGKRSNTAASEGGGGGGGLEKKGRGKGVEEWRAREDRR